MRFNFPHATELTEDVTVTCIPAFANWRALVKDTEGDPGFGYADDSVSVWNAAEDKRFRLKIPAGAQLQCDVRITKPDVYCYTVVLPGHELAGEHGYFGIVVRQAGQDKLHRAIFDSQLAANATRRRRIAEDQAEYGLEQENAIRDLGAVMAELSEQLIEQLDEDRRDEAVIELGS